ncbi:MAG TPA: IclR family transcriptional regulator [Nocardia sp.]|uniref:IclR family transcriptional regulator n=1 Tax=Nocardia sp. TaxID=1821 RepID=UPI002B4B94CE|nr:IclR family transcriptional regulator [Nocardia sp.]HLS78118.1 IclR family transcriptional regulator [Nocardia sp.]
MTVEMVGHREFVRAVSPRVSGQAVQPPVSMIERMTVILDAFDAETPTVTLLGLTERTGLPRSTVYRILDQMVRLRWLTHTPGGYRLGARAFEIGALAASHNEIREVAAPLLQDLCHRLSMAGHLAVLDGREVLFLDKAGGRQAAAVPTRLGGRLPAHSTALGKAMLATLEPRLVDASLRERLPQLTARTIADRAELHRELRRVRRQGGVAVDVEESVDGLCCVAVPLRRRGSAVAAISVSAYVDGDRPALDTARLARCLVETAQEAARELIPRHTRLR